MRRKVLLGRVSLGQLIAVAAASISLVFLLAFGGQILEIYRLRSALTIADQGVGRLRGERAALMATSTYVKSDEYAERVARAELNKIQPGDRRVIVVTRPAPAVTPEPNPAPAAQHGAAPYLDEWWALLFGS